MPGPAKSTEPFSEQACLLAALKEAQDTVRAYDTKAQIVGVGFIFSIGVITNFSAQMPKDPQFTAIGLILLWVLAIGPVALFGFVLFPSRKTAPALGDAADSVRYVLYFDPHHTRDLDAYLGDLTNADYQREVAYELLKTSGLRELKRKRFVRALTAAGLSFVIIIAAQLLRLFGLIGPS